MQSRRRILAGLAFAGVLLVILAIALVSYAELSALASSSARVQRSYDVLQTLGDLNAALTDTETNQRGYLLTQDPTYLAQYDAGIAQIKLSLTELQRLSSNEPATQTAIEQLEKLAGAKLDELQELIHATRTGQKPKAMTLFSQGAGKRLMAAFQRDSAELEAVQRRLLELRREQEHRARLSSEAVLAATVVLSLLLVGAAAQISRRFDERRRLLEQEIAERRRAEKYRESLLISERAARSEAERATRLKDDFVATLSHELRTPLNAIVGWASILGKDRRAETIAQGVEVIERNAKLQAQMIEDLLDMSRIVSGKLLFEMQPTDLAGLVEAAAVSVRPTAEAKGIVMGMYIRAASTVNGDAGRLQQVVWNLLVNAIKFTPRGGRVEVLLAETGGQAELAVTDTGQGIRAEFLPFVFDRFRQADASTTRHHGGLGLGLSIVKNLVEMHGGSVSVHSAGAGQGATFTVRLPLVARSHDAQTDAVLAESASVGANDDGPSDASTTLAGLRILVVDDEADARSLARRVLEECGAQVVTAGSAAEAMAAVVPSSVPSVIVSDIGMPEQDGYELIKQVRLLPGDAGRIPAIALTALARSEDRTRALLAGYQRHISKPVDPAELVAAIANLTRACL